MLHSYVFYYRRICPKENKDSTEPLVMGHQCCDQTAKTWRFGRRLGGDFVRGEEGGWMPYQAAINTNYSISNRLQMTLMIILTVC